MNRLDSKRARLIRLIRRIAWEAAWEAIDEHLDEYEHREKPAEDLEAGRSSAWEEAQLVTRQLEDADGRARGEECQLETG